MFIWALPYFPRLYRVLLLLLLINSGPAWCRHFQPMRINPWIFCRITFYGLYTLQPFWSIINPRLAFSFLTSQCLLCKLLSCCKQTFLIVKTLSNAECGDTDRSPQATLDPISHCQNLWNSGQTFEEYVRHPISQFYLPGMEKIQ